MRRRFTPRIVPLEDRTTPAAVGGLDQTFNGTGVTTAAFDLGGLNADTAAAVAVQRDGKIVVVGSAKGAGTDVDFAVARFNTDGTLDATFGSGGKVAIGFDLGGGNEDRATSVAIDLGGRIFVAGYAQVDAAGDYDFAVLRLTPDGALDPTFGGDGRATVAFDRGGTNADKTSGIAISSTLGVVAVGTVQVGPVDTDFGVALLKFDGVPDPAFNDTGTATVGFNIGGAKVDRAIAVDVTFSDEILVAGAAQMDAAGDFDFAFAVFSDAGEVNGTKTIGFNRGGTNEDVATAVAF
jgi:uncharacterized delta-60 repeat protein